MNREHNRSSHAPMLGCQRVKRLYGRTVAQDHGNLPSFGSEHGLPFGLGLCHDSGRQRAHVIDAFGMGLHACEFYRDAASVFLTGFGHAEQASFAGNANQRAALLADGCGQFTAFGENGWCVHFVPQVGQISGFDGLAQGNKPHLFLMMLRGIRRTPHGAKTVSAGSAEVDTAKAAVLFDGEHFVPRVGPIPTMWQSYTVTSYMSTGI